MRELLVVRSDRADVFESIKARDDGAQAQYAVVPLENSTHGPVLETTTLLFAHGDKIARYGRHTLDIRHSLMRQRGASGPIVSVCSHTQALGQCARYLRDRYPTVRRVEVASTAAAAQMALADESVLAVCSDLCASVYGLDVVEADIQDGGTSASAHLAPLTRRQPHGFPAGRARGHAKAAVQTVCSAAIHVNRQSSCRLGHQTASTRSSLGSSFLSASRGDDGSSPRWYRSDARVAASVT